MRRSGSGGLLPSEYSAGHARRRERHLLSPQVGGSIKICRRGDRPLRAGSIEWPTPSDRPCSRRRRHADFVMDLEGAVARARTGDPAGIRALYRALNPALLRYLDRRAPGEAEDLAAETWLAVAPQLPGFAGTFSDLRALIFTIARRRTVDHYRASGRRPRLVAMDTTAEMSAAIDVAETAIEAISARQGLDLLIELLPADQAEVILLRVVADLSAEEAGRVMGRSPGSIRVLQHRAFKRLADQYGSRDVTR